MEVFQHRSWLGHGSYGDVQLCEVSSHTAATLLGGVARDANEHGSAPTLVALKTWKLAHNDGRIMRIALREVQILQAIKHPNVVKLQCAFRTPSGRVCMAFEYAGKSTHQLVESRFQFGLPQPMLKRLAFQLVQALRYLHDQKIVHRDVKPANVLVDSAGVLRLCDFGFARYSADMVAPRGDDRLTPYVITRWYRAPEVLVGMAYGAAADVWSLGCTLAELATGEPLLPGQSSLDQLSRIAGTVGPLPQHMISRLGREVRSSPSLTQAAAAAADPTALRQRLGSRLGTPLLQLLEACLQVDPRDRSSMDELLRMPYFADAPRLFAGSSLERHYSQDPAYTWLSRSQHRQYGSQQEPLQPLQPPLQQQGLRAVVGEACSSLMLQHSKSTVCSAYIGSCVAMQASSGATTAGSAATSVMTTSLGSSAVSSGTSVDCYDALGGSWYGTDTGCAGGCAVPPVVAAAAVVAASRPADLRAARGQGPSGAPNPPAGSAERGAGCRAVDAARAASAAFDDCASQPILVLSAGAMGTSGLEASASKGLDEPLPPMHNHQGSPGSGTSCWRVGTTLTVSNTHNASIEPIPPPSAGERKVLSTSTVAALQSQCMSGASAGAWGTVDSGVAPVPGLLPLQLDLQVPIVSATPTEIAVLHDCKWVNPEYPTGFSREAAIRAMAAAMAGGVATGPSVMSSMQAARRPTSIGFVPALAIPAPVPMPPAELGSAPRAPSRRHITRALTAGAGMAAGGNGAATAKRQCSQTHKTECADIVIDRVQQVVKPSALEACSSTAAPSGSDGVTAATAAAATAAAAAAAAAAATDLSADLWAAKAQPWRRIVEQSTGNGNGNVPDINRHVQAPALAHWLDAYYHQCSPPPTASAPACITATTTTTMSFNWNNAASPDACDRPSAAVAAPMGAFDCIASQTPVVKSLRVQRPRPDTGGCGCGGGGSDTDTESDSGSGGFCVRRGHTLEGSRGGVAGPEGLRERRCSAPPRGVAVMSSAGWSPAADSFENYDGGQHAGSGASIGSYGGSLGVRVPSGARGCGMAWQHDTNRRRSQAQKIAVLANANSVLAAPHTHVDLSGGSLKVSVVPCGPIGTYQLGPVSEEPSWRRSGDDAEFRTRGNGAGQLDTGAAVAAAAAAAAAVGTESKRLTGGAASSSKAGTSSAAHCCRTSVGARSSGDGGAGARGPETSSRSAGGVKARGWLRRGKLWFRHMLLKGAAHQ